MYDDDDVDDEAPFGESRLLDVRSVALVEVHGHELIGRPVILRAAKLTPRHVPQTHLRRIHA